MDWVAIAAVGQMIGAGAVVVTLVYLARQITYQSRQLQTAAVLAVHEREIGQVRELNDPTLADIVVRGNEDFDSLTAEERTRYNSFAHMEHAWWETLYLLHKVGSLSDDFLKSREKYLIKLFSAPGRRVWWEHFAPDWPGAFSDYVKSKLANEPVRSLSEMPAYAHVFHAESPELKPK